MYNLRITLTGWAVVQKRHNPSINIARFACFQDTIQHFISLQSELQSHYNDVIMMMLSERSKRQLRCGSTVEVCPIKRFRVFACPSAVVPRRHVQRRDVSVDRRVPGRVGAPCPSRRRPAPGPSAPCDAVRVNHHALGHVDGLLHHHHHHGWWLMTTTTTIWMNVSRMPNVAACWGIRSHRDHRMRRSRTARLF